MTPERPIEGDAGSCRAAAAVLRAETLRLARACGSSAGSDDAARTTAELVAAAQRLADALERYGEELSRAAGAYATADRDVDRHAALALAGRARRRLRIACDGVAPPRPAPAREEPPTSRR